MISNEPASFIQNGEWVDPVFAHSNSFEENFALAKLKLEAMNQDISPDFSTAKFEFARVLASSADDGDMETAGDLFAGIFIC